MNMLNIMQAMKNVNVLKQTLEGSKQTIRCGLYKMLSKYRGLIKLT